MSFQPRLRRSFGEPRDLTCPSFACNGLWLANPVEQKIAGGVARATM